MMQSAAPGALAGAARSPEPSPLPRWSGGRTAQALGRQADALRKQDWVLGAGEEG